MAIKPTKPTVPPAPSRSNPGVDFSNKADVFAAFQSPFADYMDEIADFVDQMADDALAAATGGDLPPLTGQAGKVLAVKGDESGAEFVPMGQFPDGTAAAPSITNTGNTNTGVFFPAADTVAVATGGTERARITNDGNLMVGTTSVQIGVAADPVGITLYGNGAGGSQGVGVFVRNDAANAVLYVNNKTAGGGLVQFHNGGTAVGSITSNGTTTAYNTSSDYRLKENVQPMQDALATVAQLNPVTYTWIADGSDGQGFIAHELQAVVPDCVTGEKDAVDAEGNPQYQGVDTSFLVGILTKAIQEQQALITALTARVAALEA
jgi:hypothetical protein